MRISYATLHQLARAGDTHAAYALHISGQTGATVWSERTNFVVRPPDRRPSVAVTTQRLDQPETVRVAFGRRS